MRVTLLDQIDRNKRDSMLLMGIVVLIVPTLGYVIGRAYGGSNDAGIGLLGVFGIAAIVWTLIAYFIGARMVLAVSGAKEVTHDDEPRLWNVVEEMSIASGLPMPKIYVIESEAINAFATGRDPRSSAVAVTRGLMDRLNRDELQGVIAHEMSHIRNYDIRFATIVGILVGFIALVADLFLRSRFWGGSGSRRSGANIVFMVLAILMALVAPLFAYIVQFAISRRREFLADASAADLTRNPLGLADALSKIAADTARLPRTNRATAHLFISNPVREDRDKSSVFDTHPPIRERIRTLREMANEPTWSRDRPEVTTLSEMR